jgi:molybdenum cofactor cytidylyltransferase
MVVHSENLPVILFAAGLSTRMAKNKLLLNLEGEPLVRKTASLYLSSGAGKVYVVTGYQSEEAQDALAGLPVSFVYNGKFASGKSTSIAAGIRALPEDSLGVMFAQADMPFISVETINFLLESFRPGSGAILIPTFRGQMGSPKIFDRRYFPELLALTGDSTGSVLFFRHSASLRLVEVQDSGVLLDIDNDADLARGERDR